MLYLSIHLSVCLSVCPSRFLIYSHLLDGDMCTLLYHIHSVGGSTVGYARFQMLSAGCILLCHMILVSICPML